MPDEDLEQEYRHIEIERNKRRTEKKVKEALNLNINGFTCKDIAVRYGSYDGSEVDNLDDVNFSFFVKKDGKLYDFYYGKSVGGTGDWWPKSEDEFDEYNCGAFNEFIPRGFNEACENSYEFSGTFDEAVATLKKYGITDIEKGDW